MLNVRTRATFVARIFDILAWVVLGLGVIVAALALISNFGDNFVGGFFLAVGIVVYTAVTWAAISLASIIASYIEQKS